MRILFFAVAAPDPKRRVDGPQVHTDRFIRACKAAGHEVRLWQGGHEQAATCSRSAWRRALDLFSCDVHYVRMAGPGVPHAVLRLGDWPRSGLLKPHAIRVWEFHSLPRQGQLLGWSPQAIERTERLLRNRASSGDVAVALSGAIERQVRERYGFRRILRSTCRTELPVSLPPGKEGGLKVLWAGSTSAWLRLDLLVEAARLLWARGARDVTFELIGPPPLSDLPPNVRRYDAMPYEQLSQRLATAHVGVCLYDDGPADDGVPMKIGDYFAHGLTVLSTPQPEAAAMLAEADQADHILPRDAHVWADRLERLSADRSRLEHWAERGRRLARDRYEARKVVGQLLERIEDIRRGSP